MHLLNDTKQNLGKVICHYMGIRLKFRGTVFTESTLSDAPASPKIDSVANSQPTILEH
jgi:hypothetical protein